MPLYSYVCDACGRRKDLVRSIKEHTRTVACVCGQEMAQELGVAHIIPDIDTYKSMVTGERIRGRSHHRQHLREHGLHEVGNEPIRERKRRDMPPLVDDIKRAIQEVKSR